MPLIKVYSWYFIGYESVDNGQETGVVEHRLLAPAWAAAVAYANKLRKQNHHRLISITELDAERMQAWHEAFDEE